MALRYVCTSCHDWLNEGGEGLVWSWEEIGQSYEKSGQPWARRGRFLPTHSNAAADLETEAYLATQSCLSMLYLKRFETLSYLKIGAVKIDDNLLNLEKKPCFKNYSQTLTAQQSCNSGSNFFPEKIPRDCSARLFAKKNGENPLLLALAPLLACKKEKENWRKSPAGCLHSLICQPGPQSTAIIVARSSGNFPLEKNLLHKMVHLDPNCRHMASLILKNNLTIWERQTFLLHFNIAFYGYLEWRGGGGWRKNRLIKNIARIVNAVQVTIWS